ncbi:MAG: phosphoribosylglycinamide formyltransferase [Clostridia bacterium]|nr:phosphoribosylglycinamide formyltransferase [Clostridia bacterium]
MKKIAVLSSGGGTNFEAVLNGCKQGKINGEVVLLIYNRKEAYSRQRAQRRGIPAKYINRIASGGVEKMQQEVYEELCAAEAEIIVLAGYLEKLGKKVVENWENKIINVHPSLIPMFCGKGYFGQNVHKAVIDGGVKISGCTVHLVDANYDTGPIIMQECVTVEEEDTPQSLAEKILPHEHKCLVNSLALLCDDRIRIDKNRVFII